MPPERVTLPPVVTASRWDTLASAIWKAGGRGTVQTDDGQAVPRWTNREAMSVINALRAIGRGSRSGFPLWYQYAAVAYGWTPDDDTLVVTSTQADDDYPPGDLALLGQELRRVASDLDAAGHPDPRAVLSDVFDRKETAQEVSAALAQDGAEPGVMFKIPIPACRDPQTGRPARPVRGPDGKWSCPGGAVTIDDPLTAIIRSIVSVLSPLAVPIILIALAAQGKQKRRGRRRR